MPRFDHHHKSVAVLAVLKLGWTFTKKQEGGRREELPAMHCTSNFSFNEIVNVFKKDGGPTTECWPGLFSAHKRICINFTKYSNVQNICFSTTFTKKQEGKNERAASNVLHKLFLQRDCNLKGCVSYYDL